MKTIIPVLSLALLAACATQKETGKAGEGDTRTKPVKMLDDNSYLLTEVSSDKSYAYEPSNPVKVGGAKEESGPENEHRYLKALLGPNGEPISYYRAGSCCGFKTPNAFIGDVGLLDRYVVFWEGSEDTLNIYINMYDKGDLLIPAGLTARSE